VSPVEEFDWVALEIEADGAIGTVVDNEPHWATEGRETAAPSCELVTKTVERLLYKGDGSSRQVEVDAQKYIDADERGDKNRLGTTSFGDDDGVEPKFSPPSRLSGLVEIPLGFLDGFSDCINWHLERSRQRANKSGSSGEVSDAQFFEPAQALREVLVPAATHKLDRSQAKFLASTANKSLDCQLLLRGLGHRNPPSVCRGGPSILPS
jgi:hypothetical protein